MIEGPRPGNTGIAPGQGRNTPRWEAAYVQTRRNPSARLGKLRRFQIPPEHRILDYGCGDGLDLRVLGTLGYVHLAGIDQSSPLTHLAKGLPVVGADAYRLPFGDATFDTVFADSIFHHLEVDRALKEVARVLRPGGFLCLIEPRPSPWRQLLDWMTASPFARLHPLLYHRRIALRDEADVYASWLRGYRGFPRQLQEHGFIVAGWWNTLLSCLVRCRLATHDSRTEADIDLAKPSGLATA